MKYIRLIRPVGLLILIVFIAGCNAAPSAPTLSPDAIYTQAAQTVAAQLTSTALAMPTSTVTPQPTATLPPPTETPTELAALLPTIPPLDATGGLGTQIPAIPSLTPALAPTTGGQKPGDNATFLYNVPGDGATFSPGQKFEFAVGFLNSGQTTWTTGYRIVYFGGPQLSGKTSVNVAKSVKPGEKYEFDMTFFAPPKKGTFLNRWKLVNPQGVYMAEFYFKLVVQ